MAVERLLSDEFADLFTPSRAAFDKGIGILEASAVYCGERYLIRGSEPYDELRRAGHGTYFAVRSETDGQKEYFISELLEEGQSNVYAQGEQSMDLLPPLTELNIINTLAILLRRVRHNINV